MTTWLIIGIGATGLIASLFFSISQQRQTAEELAIATTLLREQTAKAEAALTVLDSERDAMNQMSRRLEELETKRDGLETTLHAERLTRETLEQENDEYKRWADGRLPDSAIRMREQSALNPDNQAGALLEREGTGNPGGTPHLVGPNPERAPAGSD